MLKLPFSHAELFLDGDSDFTDEANDPESEESFDYSDKSKGHIYHNEGKKMGFVFLIV